MMSITGFLTMSCMGSLLICILVCLLKSNRFLTRTGVQFLTLAAVAVMVRLLIPMELGFEKSFYFMEVIPKIQDFFMDPLITVGNRNFSLFTPLLVSSLIGTLIYAVRSFSASLQFRLALFSCETACDPAAVRALLTYYEQRKSRARFRLLQTPLATTPMLMGLFHPVIVLPDICLSEEEWASVLGHEINHYTHHDLWIKLFCGILCAVYWWNPFVHILQKQLSRLLEIQNDLAVTRHMSEAGKLEYLECLLKVAKARAKPPHAVHAAAFAGFDQSALEQRFHVVLNVGEEPPIKRTCRFFGSCFIGSLIILLSFSFVLEPQYPEPEGSISLTPENCFFVVDAAGGYSIYVDGIYWAHSTGDHGTPPGVMVYQSIDEVKRV